MSVKVQKVKWRQLDWFFGLLKMFGLSSKRLDL